MATIICACKRLFKVPRDSNHVTHYYVHVPKCPELSDEAKKDHATATGGAYVKGDKESGK